MANTLNHAPSAVLRQLLIDLGAGSGSSSGDWPVYATNEPSSPDAVVTVYDTQGTQDGRAMVGGEQFQHYGVQLRVRAADAQAGWLKADALQTLLAESVYQRVVTVGGVGYLVHCLARIGNVLALGTESPQSKRSLFTVNALMVVRLAS